MNEQHLLRIIFVLLALFSCACLAETQSTITSESETGIEGVISVGPIHGGPSRVGPSNSLGLMRKKKPTRSLLPILFIVLGVFCAQGFIGAVHQTRTSAVERDFVAALAQLQNSPPGIGRVETFVARLRAIDTNHAPV